MYRGIRILFFSLLCDALSVSKIQEFRCDYARVGDGSKWLKFHEMPSNWNDARMRCIFEGAVLASPMNEELRNIMIDTMASNKVSCAVFTGVHATFSSGDFTSIGGKRLEDIPHTWAEGEPDNYDNKENCLVMLPDGTMGDANCGDTYPYFCYRNNTPPTFYSACGTTDPHYTYDSRTGSCYKFHTFPWTWSRAYMHCLAEGGYLAIINSDTEDTVLKELFSKNPVDSMPGMFWKDVAFIGVHDWSEHYDWRTIHGPKPIHAGYGLYAADGYNNTGEYCGSINRNGLINDLRCEDKYAFICEKDPSSLLCDDAKMSNIDF